MDHVNKNGLIELHAEKAGAALALVEQHRNLQEKNLIVPVCSSLV